MDGPRHDARYGGRQIALLVVPGAAVCTTGTTLLHRVGPPWIAVAAYAVGIALIVTGIVRAGRRAVRRRLDSERPSREAADADG